MEELASAEKSFENTDGRRTDGRAIDTYLYYKLIYEPNRLKVSVSFDD